jgi:hypothetical protein
MRAQFEKFKTANQLGGSLILDRLIERLDRTFRALGFVVTNDNLIQTGPVTGPFRLYHGLGQPVTTWEVVRANSDGQIYEDTPAVNDDKYIALVSSTLGSFTIRVS